MAGSPQHVTLTANTVATLTFDEDFPEVELINIDGAGSSPVYFRFGTTAPTVGGTAAHVLCGIAGEKIRRRPKTSGATVVKLISAGTPMVSVRGIKADDHNL